MIRNTILIASLFLCVLGPCFIVYFTRKRLMIKKSFWIQIPVSILIFILSFVVIGLSLMTVGAIPFQR
jgi:hypothetical protein